MKEIEKLINLLTESCIPFQATTLNDRYHIGYPSFGEDMICSVMFDSRSYGVENGLLEIMGLVDDETYEFKEDPVEGYLTADEVFDKIKKYHFCEDKETEYRQIIYSGRKVYVKNTHRKDIYINDEAEENIKKSIEFLDDFSLQLIEASLWGKYNTVTDVIYTLNNILKEKENHKAKENQK